MELVYLANGQSCYLKEKLGDKFIVNKIYEYEECCGDECCQKVECIDETNVVVDCVFDIPPVEKISKEVSELLKKKESIRNDIEELSYKKNILKNDIENLNKTKITQDIFVLNKTELINAKNLALFAEGIVMPKVMENTDESFRGLKVSLETRINSREENYWGYKIYFDKDYSSGDFLCKKYGILINPSEEEIEETIKKRLLEFKFADYQIARVDDKYLTPAQIEIKNNYLANEKIKRAEKLNKQLADIQKELNDLEQ